ncbi:MAG: DNA gyrase C-terminal beta-propeller domain-containing protein, partial [Gammaproteobacteria bacterium]
MERIAELVKDKKVEGIREMRDESDTDGMRMVMELRRGELAEVVLSNLYQHTQLETVFGVNAVALVSGQPRTLDLKQLLECFLQHRREVVTRRTLFELRKARERAHLLEGLAVALANIDPIIATIKASASPAEAKQALLERPWTSGVVTEMLQRAGADRSRPETLSREYGLGESGYRLSPEQAQAILDLRLQRLTGLEQDKILEEYRQILERIDELLDILARPGRLMAVIREELLAIRSQFGDPRRTEIIDTQQYVNMEDLIAEEDVAVTLSHAGYAKSQPVSEYRAQKRGGKGRTAVVMREEDFIDRLFIASTHHTLLAFSSLGKAYWLKVYEIPQAGRTARGRPLINLLPLEDNERITALLPIKSFEATGFILMATSRGTVKKCALHDFSRRRASGIIAIDLPPEDRLVGVALTDGEQHAMLFSSSGKAICFHESDVRPMGRVARGVRGIRLGPKNRVISLLIVEPESNVLTATENGYGKRTPITEFPVQGRGGQGVIAIQTSSRNGGLVGAVTVREEDEIMLISDRGMLVRTPAVDISQVGRNTQGVRLIHLGEGEHLVGVERVIDVNGDGEE